MADTLSPSPTWVPSGPLPLVPRWRRVQGLLRTGRTIRFENFLGTLIVWSLLPRSRAFTGRTAELLALSLAVAIAIVAAGGTLDDIQGYRDGSDRENYERSDPTGLRPLTRKPLLLGWVTEQRGGRLRPGGCHRPRWCWPRSPGWLPGASRPGSSSAISR